MNELIEQISKAFSDLDARIKRLEALVLTAPPTPQIKFEEVVEAVQTTEYLATKCRELVNELKSKKLIDGQTAKRIVLEHGNGGLLSSSVEQLQVILSKFEEFKNVNRT